MVFVVAFHEHLNGVCNLRSTKLTTIIATPALVQPFRLLKKKLDESVRNGY